MQGGILHPPKVHVSKNANMKYDRPLLKDCITTFVLFSNVFHLSGEILNLKNNFIRKNKFPTTHFLIRNFLEIPIGKKTMGFDQNSYYITKYGKSQFLVGKLSVRTRAQLSGAFPRDMK